MLHVKLIQKDGRFLEIKSLVIVQLPRIEMSAAKLHRPFQSKLKRFIYTKKSLNENFTPD